MRISDWSSDVCSSDLLHWRRSVSRCRRRYPQQRPAGIVGGQCRSALSGGRESAHQPAVHVLAQRVERQDAPGRANRRFLRAGLLKFQKTQVKQRTTALLLPKLVERHARAGAPKSNATAAETAFEKAAVDVGVSPKTAQRAHRRFPPERDED